MFKNKKQNKHSTLSPYGLKESYGGYAGAITAPKYYRGTNRQVCGLYPFIADAGTPMIGVPVGKHLMTGKTVCCDPYNWFTRSHLISNPSLFLIGEPGLGKSTILRRMCLGLAGQGVIPLILGDIKPDYVDLIQALDGQVITIGAGIGGINPLDISTTHKTVQILTKNNKPKVAKAILKKAQTRRLELLSTLVEIVKNMPLTVNEKNILDQAIKIYETQNPNKTPQLNHIYEIIQQAPSQLRKIANDRNDIKTYWQKVDDLTASIYALYNSEYGEIFAGQTTGYIDINTPAVYDISQIDQSNDSLKASVMLTCWAFGFQAIEEHHTLADLNLTPRKHYFIITDELWQTLKVGFNMVDKINSLTRLNRSWGVAQAMCTHTLKDLEALPTAKERNMAKGFIERSGIVICAGLPPAEMPLLNQVIPLTNKDQQYLISWTTPTSWSSVNLNTPPPGQGNFLIKVGSRAGLPIHLELTPSELNINNTNKRFEK